MDNPPFSCGIPLILFVTTMCASGVPKFDEACSGKNEVQLSLTAHQVADHPRTGWKRTVGIAQR
jgi:hypothetical protein